MKYITKEERRKRGMDYYVIAWLYSQVKFQTKKILFALVFYNISPVFHIFSTTIEPFFIKTKKAKQDERIIKEDSSRVNPSSPFKIVITN